MAHREVVIVPIHVLVDRALPPVCAVTGEPSERLEEFRFSNSSLTRALAAAFVRAPHARDFVKGSVPLSERRIHRRSVLARAAAITAVGAVVAGIVAVAKQTMGPAVAMGVLLAAASAALIWRATISPQGVLQGKYVWLTRVDPVFAAAALDLVKGVRRPREDEHIARAGIGPIPMRAMVGIGIWLFVIVWIAVR